jgi:hypothetical protein
VLGPLSLWVGSRTRHPNVTPPKLSYRAMSPPLDTALERGKDLSQRTRHHREVPVVKDAAVQLAAELGQNIRPVPVPRRAGPDRRVRSRHNPLDDLNRCPAGLGSALLLPGPLPAGSRTPLGDRPARPRGDRSAAPPAVGRGSPSCAAARQSRNRRRSGRTFPSGSALLLLTTLALPLKPTSSVVGASLAPPAPNAPHQGARTRHHESGRPLVHKVCRS